MINVNPPPRPRMPQTFLRDREVNGYMEQLQTIIFQLYTRSGGSGDAMAQALQDIVTIFGELTELDELRPLINKNTSDINGLLLKAFKLVTVTSDYTTGPNEVINCENTTPITITLDPNAKKMDEVNIKRANAKVTVIGLIDGKSDRIINIKNYSLKLAYTGSRWIEI